MLPSMPTIYLTSGKLRENPKRQRSEVRLRESGRRNLWWKVGERAREIMTKKAPKSGLSWALSTSCSGGSSRNLELATISSEEARRSTRLRLQPLRKPKTNLKKKKPVKLHSKMPKKPPTAFFYFLDDFRKQYQEQNPEVKSMREIGKTCGEKWKTMTYEEKVNYYDIATEKREEFQQAMTAYTKRMESGEYDESETDSDCSE